MIARANLEIYQGDDYAAMVAVTMDDTAQTPVDLTGSTAKAQIRRDAADRSSIVADIAATITAPLTGEISLGIGHDVTETLTGKYVWDLQIVSAAGAITTILAGSVTVTSEITRQAAV